MESVIKRSSVRPTILLSVCLSRRSTTAAEAGGFAAEVGRGQQIIDRQLLLPREAA